jgi:hypothetical protein
MAAEVSFHEDRPRWFEVKPIIAKLAEFDQVLLDNEQLLGRLANHLANLEGKSVTTQSGPSSDVVTAIDLVPIVGTKALIHARLTNPHFGFYFLLLRRGRF